MTSASAADFSSSALTFSSAAGEEKGSAREIDMKNDRKMIEKSEEK